MGVFAKAYALQSIRDGGSYLIYYMISVQVIQVVAVDVSASVRMRAELCPLLHALSLQRHDI